MGSEPVFFEQRMVNNLRVQRVWGSWKNLRRELGEASASAACRRRQTFSKSSAAKNKQLFLPDKSLHSDNFTKKKKKKSKYFWMEEAKRGDHGTARQRETGGLPSEDYRSPAVAAAEIVSCCWGAAAPRGSHCSYGSSRRRGWKCSGSGASWGCCWTGRLQKITSKRKWGQEQYSHTR